MKTFLPIAVLFTLTITSCGENKGKQKTAETLPQSTSNVNITPVKHATAVIQFEGKTLYLDPTGGSAAFEGYPDPDMVFITDVHGDHMNTKTLSQLNLKKATIVAPKAVADQLRMIDAKEIMIMNNGETKSFDSFSVEAIPMYNLREEALKFHPKGRGNGYLFTMNGERIYFSGDTEDIPEMRALKNIDKAFVCMNLPYTMTVESAASAVLEFKPKQVFPYHYRGNSGFSDIARFKELIQKEDKNIEVVQLKWY